MGGVLGDVIVDVELWWSGKSGWWGQFVVSQHRSHLKAIATDVAG